MSKSACAAAKFSLIDISISLFVSGLMILLPLGVRGQAQTTENVPTKTQEPTASPSPTPTASPKKPEEEKKPDEATRPKEPMSTPTFNGLKFRSIGPAFTSGRVVGFSLGPTSRHRYQVA